jgi:hypothetical protein
MYALAQRPTSHQQGQQYASLKAQIQFALQAHHQESQR